MRYAIVVNPLPLNEGCDPDEPGAPYVVGPFPTLNEAILWGDAVANDKVNLDIMRIYSPDEYAHQ